MDPIARITSNDEFTKLFKAVLSAEYDDFQTIDDSGGDRGNDGYSQSNKTLFQQYCPEKPENRTKAEYKKKIKTDLGKAKKLVESGEYVIERWIFVTPQELSEGVQTYIRTEATARGFEGIAWASPKLTGLLTKHSNLRSQFPNLTLPDIEKQLESVEQNIVGRLDSVEEVEKKYKTDLEQKYSRKIDDARTILNNRNYPEAKREYESILRDLKNETVVIDKHLFFRTYNNLGVAEENLGNQDVAADLFEKAYEAEPTLPMAIAKHALAIMFKNPTEALKISEELLKNHPNDENGISAKVNSLYFLGRYPELFAYIKEINKPAWLNWFQGHEAMSRQDLKAAAQFFENVIGLEPDNAKAYMYAAQNILVDSKGFLSENPLPLNKLPDDIRIGFEKAISWLKEAVKLSKERGIKTDLEMAYTNLASCLGGIGLFKESLEAATEAVLIDPNSQMGLYNKAVAQLKLGKFGDSLETLKKFEVLAGSNPEVSRHIAFCALQTNDLALAEKTIEPELHESSSLDLSAVEVGLEIYSRKLATEKLEKLLKRVEEEFPNDPRAIRIRANYLQKIGSPEALPLYELALEKSKSESEIFLSEIDIADCLYEAREYQKSAEIYAKYTDTKHNNIANDRFAVSLFESGQHGRLLGWVETLEKHVRSNYMIRQSEAYSNWTLNNLEQAGKIFKELFEKDHNSLGYLVYYGMCQFRLGNEPEAKRAYDAIKNKVSSASDLAALAGGYEFIGDRNLPIELTYKGLQNEPHNPKAHLAFIFAFFRREQVGEKEFDEKYVKAFQASLANFNARFPEEKALQGFEVKGDDISEILKAVDRMSEVTDNAKNLYQDSKAPLATVPKITGKKPFDVWAAFTNMPEVGIKIAFGSEDEMKADNSTAEEYSGRAIIIDIYPLFLLGFLEKLNLLEDTFEKIYIHQKTVDELTETIEDQRISAEKGVTSLGKIDGKHRMTEISPEAIKKSLTMLETVRDFITKSGKFEIRGLAKEVPEEKDSMLDILDESTRDSVLLAKELNIPLCNDDRILRAILRNEFKIKSFSTQSLMYLLQKKGKITLKERYELQRKLIDLNYDFISLDGLFIYDQLEKEAFQTEPLARIISYLTRKDTSIQSLVTVFADFLMLLMRNMSIPSKQKIEIVHAFLKEAKKNHDLLKIEEGVLDITLKRLPANVHEQIKVLIRIFFNGV